MYKITYINNSCFISKNPTDSRWNEINNIIKKLEYDLGGKKIILDGYEAYNHLVVRHYALLSKKQFISKIILLAKNKDKVIKFVFDLIKKRFTIEEELFGKEFDGQATTGWKNGEYNHPQYLIE